MFTPARVVGAAVLIIVAAWSAIAVFDVRGDLFADSEQPLWLHLYNEAHWIEFAQWTALAAAATVAAHLSGRLRRVGDPLWLLWAFMSVGLLLMLIEDSGNIRYMIRQFVSEVGGSSTVGNAAVLGAIGLVPLTGLALRWRRLMALPGVRGLLLAGFIVYGMAAAMSVLSPLWYHQTGQWINATVFGGGIPQPGGIHAEHHEALIMDLMVEESVELLGAALLLAATLSCLALLHRDPTGRIDDAALGPVTPPRSRPRFTPPRVVALTLAYLVVAGLAIAAVDMFGVGDFHETSPRPLWVHLFHDRHLTDMLLWALLTAGVALTGYLGGWLRGAGSPLALLWMLLSVALVLVLIEDAGNPRHAIGVLGVSLGADPHYVHVGVMAAIGLVPLAALALRGRDLWALPGVRGYLLTGLGLVTLARGVMVLHTPWTPHLGLWINARVLRERLPPPDAAVLGDPNGLVFDLLVLGSMALVGAALLVGAAIAFLHRLPDHAPPADQASHPAVPEDAPPSSHPSADDAQPLHEDTQAP